ncbi:AAA domain containing protein [uncultured Caudovirales phage]|uniref:AAA domain containing protein n=1 Tax=uncultured Caudovirales phage TaxID=2100421 RepID=A0A6J5RTZ6_9CAUD|nr:AAA domain containing protein [uncultured Caudovirales phage]
MSTQDIQNFNNLLRSFNIKAECVSFNKMNSYFYFDLQLKPTAKVKDIQKYSDELSLALMAPSKPSIRVLHESGVVRLEFAENSISKLNLISYLRHDDVPTGEAICLLGQMVNGDKMWMDLTQNPHMIISGTTGSGKSTLLHNIIANLLVYNNVDLILVDPKMTEFYDYDLNFKSIPVHNSYIECIEVIDNLIKIMESRYELMRAGKNLSEFKPIVLIIDEFADLIMQDSDNRFGGTLCKLAQKCRAAKIHLVLSTQRPSVDIINGAIKANFPARIACRASSHVDSKVILDAPGAENLRGKGDALLRDNYRFLERFQIAYIDSKEVCKYFR